MSASKNGGRKLGDSGEKTPRFEARDDLFAIERSAQQMPLEREVLPDRPEARQEGLGARGQTETSHAALAFPRGLVAVFGTVVHAGTGLDEHVLHTRQLRELRFGGRVTAQLVGDDLFRCLVTGRPHPLEEAFRGGALLAHRSGRPEVSMSSTCTYGRPPTGGRRVTGRTLSPSLHGLRAAKFQHSALGT